MNWRRLAVLLVVVPLVALVAFGCVSCGPGTHTAGVARSSAESLWQQSLSWLRSGPVQAVFTYKNQEYTILYADKARLAYIDQPHPQFFPVLGGGQIIMSSRWWANETDYYYLQEKGPPVHVTPKMAAALLVPSFFQPFGEPDGVFIIASIRLRVDPYRVLDLSRPLGAPEKRPDGNWKVEGETTIAELAGTDIASDGIQLYSGSPGALVHSSLEVTPAGVPVAMTVSVDGFAGPTEYQWSRAVSAPKMPSDAMDLDRMLQAQLKEGGARTPTEAAQESKFPLFWPGETYAHLTIQEVTRETDGSYLLTYSPPPTGTTTTSNPAAGILVGYDLHEYGVVQDRATIRQLLAGMWLYRSVGHGKDGYALYTATSPAQNYGIILREETAIQVQRYQGDGALAPSPGELVTMAAALTRLEP